MKNKIKPVQLDGLLHCIENFEKKIASISIQLLFFLSQ